MPNGITALEAGTMTDKELLELAAKAAGYTLEDHHDINGEYWPWCIEEGEYWCPLTDDGDALRLAVKLDLAVVPLGDPRRRLLDQHGAQPSLTLVTWGIGATKQKTEELHNDDPYAATRRAIVRAAAEIARNMG